MLSDGFFVYLLELERALIARCTPPLLSVRIIDSLGKFMMYSLHIQYGLEDTHCDQLFRLATTRRTSDFRMFLTGMTPSMRVIKT